MESAKRQTALYAKLRKTRNLSVPSTGTTLSFDGLQLHKPNYGVVVHRVSTDVLTALKTMTQRLQLCTPGAKQIGYQHHESQTTSSKTTTGLRRNPIPHDPSFRQ